MQGFADLRTFAPRSDHRRLPLWEVAATKFCVLAGDVMLALMRPFRRLF